MGYRAITVLKAENSKLKAEARRLRAFEQAMNNHLCEHDAADWLACCGEHNPRCEICDEEDNGQTMHVVKTEVERLRQAICRLNFVDSGDELAIVYHADDCALEVWSNSNTDDLGPPPCDCDREELQALVDGLRGD